MLPDQRHNPQGRVRCAFVPRNCPRQRARAIMLASLTDTGDPAMRRKNPRIVIVGSVLIVLAVAFFLFFFSIASKSNNPAELMRTVGTVSGVVTAIGVAMAAVGLVGRKI